MNRRRESQRLSIEMELSFSTKFGEMGIINWSDTGLAVQSEYFLAKDIAIICEMNMDEQVMEFQAEVRWTEADENNQSYYIGLEFIGDRSLTRRLTQFLEKKTLQKGA